MPSLDRRQFLITTGLAATPLAMEASPAGFAATNLRVEYCDRPLAIEENAPRFSWQIASRRRNFRQTAYRIAAASSEAGLKAGRYDIWDSGRVKSGQSFEASYRGRALHSGERIWWRVILWDEKGRLSAPSEIDWFEMGLLDPADWRGDWLIAQSDEETAARAAGLHWMWSDTPPDEKPVKLRYRFKLKEKPAEAELWLSAKDTLMAVWANGADITPRVKAFWGTMCELPVTLKRGENVICVEASATGNDFHPYDGGAVAAQLRLTYFDGRVERLAPGPEWRASAAAQEGWNAPDFDDEDWRQAVPTKAVMQCEPWPAMPAMLVRRVFAITKPVARARLIATALGGYEPYLNGARVGNAHLSPEISMARDHVYYQKYDVTAQLRSGRNAVGALVGDGQYGSAFGARDERFPFADGPRRFRAQLEIDYADGSREIVATGKDWRIAESPVRASDIYNGEHYDARGEIPGWAAADFEDAGWRVCPIGKAPPCRLIAQNGPAIKVTGTLKPVAVTEPKPGVFVYDFGQNFAGWTKLAVKGAAGDAVMQRFAEVLKADGSADQANLRGAKATDRYVLRGDAAGESYEPHLTYHGFRYVEVSGYPGKPDAAALTGIAARSDAAETGTFLCENALVQHIWQNALWSQRSNFFAIPTDCPQRDERMGWTGDIQVFLDAAAFNMDVDAFIRRYLIEVRAEQLKDGGFPVLAPAARSYVPVVSPGWSEAGVILPWTLWRRYGDVRAIEDNWAAMTRWMQFLVSNNPDGLWRNKRGTDLGDWLAVDAKLPGDETTPKLLVATAFWAQCARLMEEMARATGKNGEAQHYGELRAKIASGFAAAFVKPDGTIGNGSQSSYVLALHFGLVPQALRAAAGARLADDIKKRGMKLSTGFLGTPHLLDVLSENGQTDIAVSLLLSTDYPSWGYMIVKGATAMWERWNSDTGDVAMNSYNHYAFGAVAGFMYRRLAGIAPAAPGFAKIDVRPVFDPRIGRVRGEYLSCLGRISSDVRGDKNGLSRLMLEIPANASARIVLPNRRWHEGRKSIAGRSDLKIVAHNAREIVIETGSGAYDFRV
jgi:alpha-L-rhamnosidase